MGSTLAVSLVVLALAPASADGAGRRATAGKPDILKGLEVWHGPCAFDRVSADYQSGVDVYSNPVEPADTGVASLSIPGDTVLADVPPKGRRAPPVTVAVTLDGLSDRLNPTAYCALPKPPAH